MVQKFCPRGMSVGHQWSKSRILGPFFIVTQLLLGFWARILILLHALLMRTGGTHLEFWFAWRYAMALARRYVMAHHQLALVFHAKCTQQLLKWYSYLLLNHWIVLMSTDLFLSHYPEISGLLLMGSSYIPFICTYLGGRSYRHQNL